MFKADFPHVLFSETTMFKKSLTVLALASFVAVGACKKADETEGLGVDTTTAAPAAAPAPVLPDTLAAPAPVDSAAAVTDSAAVDTAQH